MPIDELISVITPPDTPHKPSNGETQKCVESTLGLRMPGDFFDLSRLYGSGRFSNGAFEIYIDNPADSYAAAVCRRSGTIIALQTSEGREFLPYAPFPKRPGLLSIGSEDNGDSLYWWTDGEPEKWPIVILRRHDGSVDRYDYPITTFLAGVFSGSLSPHPWPEWVAESKQAWRFHPKKT